MKEDKENWASVIRSCVLSSKKPLTPTEVNRDTKILEGKNIPYKQLNYNTLVDMLKDINGLIVFKANGETLVKAEASKKTEHLAKMIRLQKNPKKLKKKPLSSPKFNNRQPKTHQPEKQRKEATETFDRQQRQQSHSNASSSTYFEQTRTPFQFATPSFQYQNLPQRHPEFQNVLILQPIIQVVPFLLVDARLMLNNNQGAPALTFIPYLHLPQPLNQ